MADPCTTDQKLDQQTSLLKWVLAGVGAALLSLAGFAGAVFNRSLDKRDETENYLRSDIKAALEANGKTQASIATAMEQQTQILKEIRDDQKKFPAVASGAP